MSNSKLEFKVGDRVQSSLSWHIAGNDQITGIVVVVLESIDYLCVRDCQNNPWTTTSDASDLISRRAKPEHGI